MRSMAFDERCEHFVNHTDHNNIESYLFGEDKSLRGILQLSRRHWTFHSFGRQSEISTFAELLEMRSEHLLGTKHVDLLSNRPYIFTSHHYNHNEK